MTRNELITKINIIFDKEMADMKYCIDRDIDYFMVVFEVKKEYKTSD